VLRLRRLEVVSAQGPSFVWELLQPYFVAKFFVVVAIVGAVVVEYCW
jgi:hypothetical protein